MTRHYVTAYTKDVYTIDGKAAMLIPDSQQAFVGSIYESGLGAIPLYVKFEDNSPVFYKYEPEIQPVDFAGIGIKIKVEEDTVIEFSDTYKKELFDQGVKASFDYIRNRAANNYHQKPEIQKVCDAENELLYSVSDDLLTELSPDRAAEWKTISSLLAEIRELKSQLESK